MHLFLESANLHEIEQATELGVIDGVFLTPALARQQDVEYPVRIAEICQRIAGPVTADVTGHFLRDMLAEAEALAAIDPRIIIKLPATKPGLRALKQLVRRGARVNITLCFSPSQAMIAAKAGATYVTLYFAPRDDSTDAARKLITKTRRIFENYSLACQIATGPIRSAAHLTDAAVAGADAAVIDFAVIDDMLNNPRTDRQLRRMLTDLRRQG